MFIRLRITVFNSFGTAYSDRRLKHLHKYKSSTSTAADFGTAHSDRRLTKGGRVVATKKFNALMFDTRSIQRYIYSGNLLRTNIGASYIVDRIFFDDLRGTLTEIFSGENFSYAADTTWDIDEDGKTYWGSMNECCVAYVGGGNALILFNPAQIDRRVEVVQKFTRKLLATRPGLKVGVALGELEMTDDGLDMSSLYAELKKNQSNVFPAVNVPYTGLTLSCEINGEVANFCDARGLVKLTNEVRFYSMETAVKAECAKAANESLKNRFNKIFDVKKSSVTMKDFYFPMKVDELGQKDGENYFSIIHVDGNNMGVKFRGCKSLTDRRQLSREIRRKTEGAFADLLLKIIAAKNAGLFDEILNLKDENILPIRPLIIGGDDVTFICPANMAILFTKTLMESLNDETPAGDGAPEHLTMESSRLMDCCAGVAILPTAYPFFRGYKLAEQLCDAAKESMRKEKKSSSWLDFAILHGEQAPTLEQIREQEYTGALGNLHFGPYQVGAEKNSRYDIENLIVCTKEFPKVMSHGKIKELRGVLQRGKADIEKFLQQLKLQNQRLPSVQAWEFLKTNSLWSNENSPRTPYVDAIELMDFFPSEVADEWQRLT